MLSVYAKTRLEKVTKNFTSDEFDCACNNPECTKTYLDDAAIEKLEVMRKIIGAPIVIHSAYRCYARQTALRNQGKQTSKGTSHHEVGSAFDVSSAGMNGEELAMAAREAGFQGIGIASDWIHCDDRSNETEWTYDAKEVR